MPVFGGSKNNPRYVAARKKYLGQQIKWVGNRKILLPRPPWDTEDSSLRRVSNRLGFDISTWVKKRNRKTQQPVVVLDWGCGPGTAITTLVQENPEIVTGIGFSDIAYNEMNENPHVRFIQNTADKLFRYRFMKPNSLDLIFSHFGLHHFQTTLFGKTFDQKEYRKYILALARCLKPGGILVTTNAHQIPDNVKAWKLATGEKITGFKFLIRGGRATLVVRKKEK